MQNRRVVEVLVGVGLGVLLYLFVTGYNIIPLLAMIGLGGLLYFFLEQKGVLHNSTMTNSAPRVELPL